MCFVYHNLLILNSIASFSCSYLIRLFCVGIFFGSDLGWNSDSFIESLVLSDNPTTYKFNLRIQTEASNVVWQFSCLQIRWLIFIHLCAVHWFLLPSRNSKILYLWLLAIGKGEGWKGDLGGGGILTIRNHYSMMPFPLLELINQRSMIRRLQAIDSVSEMPRLLGLRLELRLRCRFPSIPNLKMSCHNYVGRKTSRVGDLRLNSIS